MVGVALFLSAPPPPPPVFAPSGPSGLAESTCLTSTTPSEEPYVSASASPSHPLSPHAHSLLAASSHLPLFSPPYLTSPALLSPSHLSSTTPPQLSWPHFTTSVLWQPLSPPSPTCSSPFPISTGSPLYLSPLLTPLQLTFTASAFFCHPFNTSHLSHPFFPFHAASRKSRSFSPPPNYCSISSRRACPSLLIGPASPLTRPLPDARRPLPISQECASAVLISWLPPLPISE